MYFKIGVTCALDAPEGSPFPLVNPNIYATVDFLAENGFDSIELHLLHPSEVDGSRIKEYCAAKGLLISSIGTGMAYGREGLSITSPDVQVRKRAIQRLKEQLDLASELECSIVIGSMRGEIRKGSSKKEIDKQMIEGCKELCEYASAGKGSIVIEAIDRFETNYLQTAEEVMDIIEQVDSDKLGVHLDTYHMNMEECDWKKPVLLCGKKLRHVHVADNNRNYPGWGLIDFKPFLRALDEIGYDQTLTLECYPRPDGKTAVKRGLQHLRMLMDR
ncbi:MAG: sugar phosphate isomerase/epimerase family protein [Hungatella sp.]